MTTLKLSNGQMDHVNVDDTGWHASGELDCPACTEPLKRLEVAYSYHGTPEPGGLESHPVSCPQCGERVGKLLEKATPRAEFSESDLPY